MKLTPFAKFFITVVILGVLGYAVWHYRERTGGLLEKVVPSAKEKESKVPLKADLPPIESAAPSNSKVEVASSTIPGCPEKPEVRFLVWAWNAQMGGLFANGGPQATRGSLMCKNSVNLKFIREDDSGKMQEALVSFATELSRGSRNPSKGAHFVAIMGDGGAQFLKGINDTLARLGSEYKAKVVGSMGYSRGEDKFMGPAEWKSNPAASRGGVVAGVLRDGDWNIALKWLGDNGLCNNPDEKTYDSGCLNWVAASDYIDAGEKYISGYCDDRAVVKQGKKTGETKHVCVNGVVTWTPGDVNVAQKKGGLVSIVSTREYTSQMPNVVIGIDKWMKDNRSSVEGMLSAFFDGGDAVKSNPAALRRGAEVSAAVYHESDAEYWEKYYKGVVETDKQGLTIPLGGSTANNLADNLILFGLRSGSSNLFAATYKVFGDIVVQQYPDLVPNYPSVNDILDTSYVQAIARRSAPTTEAELPKFAPGERVKTVVSRRSWQINFESGKATFTSEAQRDLEQLLRDLLVAGGTVVEIHGHTDSQGSAQKNMVLSEERAFAVKSWLESRAPVNFPSGRIRVYSHGQQNPVASNSTAEGRAQNRRVEIVLGTTGG